MGECWRPARSHPLQDCPLRANQVPGRRIRIFNWNLRLGSKAVSQVHELQVVWIPSAHPIDCRFDGWGECSTQGPLRLARRIPRHRSGLGQRIRRVHTNNGLSLELFSGFSTNTLQTNATTTPHCIVVLPNSNGMQLLLCYDSEYLQNSIFLLMTSSFQTRASMWTRTEESPNTWFSLGERCPAAWLTSQPDR